MRSRKDGHGHDAHRDAIAGLAEGTARMQVPDGAEALHASLLAAVRRLLEDLAEHMRLEDEVLFPPFSTGPRRAPG